MIEHRQATEQVANHCVPWTLADVTRRDVTWRVAGHYELLTIVITSSQNDVIVCNIVATAHIVCYTVTTAFTLVCYDAEAGATLRSNKAHFPPYFSLSLSFLPFLSRSLDIPSPLPQCCFSTDSFSSSTRHLPRSSSAPIATTTTTTGPRHGLSLSVFTDELYRSTSF